MEFIDAILKEKQNNKAVVIADIKCYSPKDGDLLRGRNPVDIARELVLAGAKVLSVVTEEKEFHGSLKLLKEIHAAVQVPILRKDFIHTTEDLIETKECGASAILLMCSCLSKEELVFLYHEAIRLGLDPFVETHTEEEMAFARELGAGLIGINNRDILQLERDNGTVALTEKLAGLAPKHAILVSESSISNSREARLARKAGADCILVGTSILNAPNLTACYQSLLRPLSVKFCGMMDEAGIHSAANCGADIAGFVVEYPKAVPWQLERAAAKALISMVPTMLQTCVVTGGSTEHIMELARELRPSILQLHYRETGEEVQSLIPRLHEMGIRVMKPFPQSDEQKLAQYNTTDNKKIIRLLSDAGLDILLVDTRDDEHAESTNLRFNYTLYSELKHILSDLNTSMELYAAGGIDASNISDILERGMPDGIDILSGAESSPGVKSDEKMKQIMKKLR